MKWKNPVFLFFPVPLNIYFGYCPSFFGRVNLYLSNKEMLITCIQVSMDLTTCKHKAQAGLEHSCESSDNLDIALNHSAICTETTKLWNILKK